MLESMRWPRIPSCLVLPANKTYSSPIHVTRTDGYIKELEDAVRRKDDDMIKSFLLELGGYEFKSDKSDDFTFRVRNVTAERVYPHDLGVQEWRRYPPDRYKWGEQTSETSYYPLRLAHVVRGRLVLGSERTFD